jgi:hypothetical protein
MLSEQDIALIEGALKRGCRVEIIPTRDSVRIIRVRRDVLNKDTQS